MSSNRKNKPWNLRFRYLILALKSLLKDLGQREYVPTDETAREHKISSAHLGKVFRFIQDAQESGGVPVLLNVRRGRDGGATVASGAKELSIEPFFRLLCPFVIECGGSDPDILAEHEALAKLWKNRTVESLVPKHADAKPPATELLHVTV